MPDEPTPTAKGIDDPSLPAELRGKSAKEIVDYYNRREQGLKEELDTVIKQQVLNPPEPKEPELTFDNTTDQGGNDDIWKDPASYIKKNTVSRDEFQKTASSIQATLIETARLIAKDKYSDWAKWEPAVIKLIQTCEPHTRANPKMWETCYIQAKGMSYDQGVTEARTQATKIATEKPTPAPAAPSAPAEFTAEQQYVANKMGLSKEQYLKAQGHLATSTLPMTFDSRRNRGLK